MNQKVKGYILGAVAAATYGMNPLFALNLYKEGLNPDSVLFFRYLFAIPILGAMLIYRGRSFKINKGETLPLILSGALFAISSLTLFESYNYMNAGIASTLLFVYPIMVAMIMTFFFKEKIELKTIICILMAMIGIGLLYKGSNGATLSLTGTLLTMASALSYAIYIVGINQSRLKNVPTIKITFYVVFFGWLLYGIRAIFTKSIIIPEVSNCLAWINIFALALLPTAVSLLCTTRAIQFIGSTTTAILGALEPATAIFFGITIFGEKLTFRDSIGLTLIIVAVSLVVAGNAISSYIIRLRKLFPKLKRK